ncbi:MAG: hypothetical protein ACI8QC_004517 [Planctomycetota bacterium]|jgi:hypothetical protein
MKCLTAFVVAFAILSAQPLHAQFVSISGWNFSFDNPASGNYGTGTVTASASLSGPAGVELKAQATATDTGPVGGSREIHATAQAIIEIGPAGASVRIDEVLDGVLDVKDSNDPGDHATLRTSITLACTKTGYREVIITTPGTTQTYTNQSAVNVICLGEGTYQVSISLVASARIGDDFLVTDTNSSDFFTGLRSWIVEFSGVTGPTACGIVGASDPACVPLPNSTGAIASVELLRTGSSPQNDGAPILALVHSGPPQQFGYFFASQTAGNYFVPNGSSGRICVSGQIYRLNNPIFVFDAAGEAGFCGQGAQITTNGSLPGIPAMTAGSTWYFQAWYRDFQTSNFTESWAVNF